MQPLLLDTCAMIWIAEGKPLKPEAVTVLNNTHAAGVTTFVSRSLPGKSGCSLRATDFSF